MAAPPDAIRRDAAGDRLPAGRRSMMAALALALLPVLMLFALAGLALQSSHTQHVRRAELLTQNLAALLAQGLSSDIEKIDLALVSIAEMMR
ncbi:MAG: hypothetical protein CFE45_33405, partial [Burkholderiales bacterium PBB5]